MKRLKSVPIGVLQTIQTEHQRAMEVVSKNYKKFCSLPVRPSRMRIIRNGKESFEQTIVPATSIYIRPDAFLDKDHLNRDSIMYFVDGTKEAFPFGHVYHGSGQVCLGTIFVPAKVPKHSPQQPLETLFLHNDRNLNHGDGQMNVNENTKKFIRTLLIHYGIQLSPDTQNLFNNQKNWLVKDTIWLIGAEVYMQADFLKAIGIMSRIYNYIFQQKG